jgi:hypothetical protein
MKTTSNKRRMRQQGLWCEALSQADLAADDAMPAGATQHTNPSVYAIQHNNNREKVSF